MVDGKGTMKLIFTSSQATYTVTMDDVKNMETNCFLDEDNTLVDKHGSTAAFAPQVSPTSPSIVHRISLIIYSLHFFPFVIYV
jgi:hypothetical protein